MIYLCELNYKFYKDADCFISEKQSLLDNCIGQQIKKLYALFDTRDKEWVLDGPILAEFTNGTLYIKTKSEINLSVEWNVVFTSEKPAWIKTNDTFFDWQEYLERKEYSSVNTAFGEYIHSIKVNTSGPFPTGLTFILGNGQRLVIEDCGDITNAYIK